MYKLSNNIKIIHLTCSYLASDFFWHLKLLSPVSAYNFHLFDSRRIINQNETKIVGSFLKTIVLWYGTR